jgi:hypothetical protein
VFKTRQDCEYNPDLVNDFFGLSLRYIKKAPGLFYQCNELETFVQLLLRCACIENLNAAKTHSNFIKEISKSIKEDLMEAQSASGHHAESLQIECLSQK